MTLKEDVRKEILELAKPKLSEALGELGKNGQASELRGQVIQELKSCQESLINIELPRRFEHAIFCGIKEGYSSPQEEKLVIEVVTLLQNCQRPNATSIEAYKIISYFIKIFNEEAAKLQEGSITKKEASDAQGFLRDLAEIAAGLLSGSQTLPINPEGYPFYQMALKSRPQSSIPKINENYARLQILLALGQIPLMPWDVKGEEEFSLYALPITS